MTITESFIRENNQRLLSSFDTQDRYVFHKEGPNKSKPTNEVIEWIRKVYVFEYRKTITEICELTGTPNSTGSRLNKAAVKFGFIKVFTHGRKRYPVLTEEGYAAINTKPKKFYGRGAGEYHVFYQHRVQEHFIHLNPQIELQKKETFIDVAIHLKDGTLICIEIAMTSKNEKVNIEKDYQAGADLIVLACHGEKVLKEVNEIVFDTNEDVRSRVLTCTLDDLLKLDPNDFLKSLGRSE